jgi:hypothetical protein
MYFLENFLLKHLTFGVSFGMFCSGSKKVYYLRPIFFQNISPGQIPVIPAKVNKITGT